MKLVLVEDRLDRVMRIVPSLLDSIERIIIYQSERQFEASKRQYRKEPFFEKLQRVDAWSIYETLDQLYEACDEVGQPRNVLLFDLCLEDERVAFLDKLSVIYIKSKESTEGTEGRCFIYTTFDRMQQELRSNFKKHVVETDLSQENFLLYKKNALLCEALLLSTGGGRGVG